MLKICSLTPFTTKYSIQWANNSLGISNPNENLVFPFDNITDPFVTQTKNFNSVRFNYFYVQHNTFTLNDSEKKKLGSSLDDFLLMCQFASQPCNKTNDFEYYFDKINGNCFRYNSGKNGDMLKVVQPGINNGINLELLIEPVSENDNLFATQHGFQIFITNQQTEFVFSTGVQVSPGYSTNINIKREISSTPQKPFSDCINNLNSIDSYDSDLYRKTFISNPIYLEDDCKLLCFNKILHDTCNCTEPSFIPYYDSNLFCLSYQKLDCEFKHYKKFIENDDFSKCDCPKTCKTITYSYSSSMSEYPTKSYAYALMQNPMILRQFKNKTLATFDEIRKRVISVNIFYNELAETLITAQPKTDIPSLVSNIGGILGLFLGIKTFL
jgi:hypothetical protein